MVHVIPLSIAGRRLDTGNAPQYPQGSPIGGAMQGLGDHLAAVAERYQQMKDQQDAFDAEIARRRFNGQIAQAEDEVTANAPADGAGLHEAMYGQVNPYDGRVAKTGLFDKLFAAALPGMPESQRAAFASQKEAMRRTGSLRMAARQIQRRKDYEKDQLSRVHAAELNNIVRSDPNDYAAFDAARRRGLDLITKMGLDPQSKAQAEAAWFDRSAKTRFETLIARNPRAALNLLGLKNGAGSGSDLPPEAVDEVTTGSVAQADSFGASNGKEDRIRKVDPSERVGQAFQDNLPIDVLLAQLSPESYGDLVRQARSAEAASFISMHAGLNTDTQKAKAALANMEPYSGSRYDDSEFAHFFGAEEGGNRSRNFNWRVDVSPYVADMRVTPTSEVDASVFAAKPVPNRFSPKQDPEMYKQDQARFERDQRRYELNADAAAFVIQQRQVDPAGYARKVTPALDAALKDLSTPESLRTALALSFASQRQLGIAKPQPLPQSDAEGLLKTWADSPDPEQARQQALKGIVDPKWRKSLAKQLDDIEAARAQPTAALDSDRIDDVDSERPAEFAKSIHLSPADIIRLKKTLMTEWFVKDGDDEAKGVIDTILNRLASEHWGHNISDVVNYWAQFSDVNSKNTIPLGRNDIDQLSVDDPRFAKASKMVDEYLLQRASGTPSKVGDNLNYANPKVSDAANLVWINKLDGPRLGQHWHGTTDENQRYRPGKFRINLPKDYYPLAN
ncbi:cell wall hydrolase [Mesorhizobium sp. NZP2298]|uniref:cell wall hydrolase n=1 Tax=Mesorhizobium sp. NZP2298 TaxID=2483403 RepID=UPI0015554A97|nr:cell wall hydrolase [Mesorhizobium sp. NZP2298]QKC96059.1 hypothetical protein EB231_16160 [Mesorhizobium sp. NZP2298]